MDLQDGQDKSFERRGRNESSTDYADWTQII